MATVFEIIEGSTAKYSATLVDQDGNAIALADMTTIKLTLYNADDATRDIINSRNATNVLNLNGGSFAASGGLFTFSFTSSDNVLIKPVRSREEHRAFIEYTWNSGTQKGNHEIRIMIINRAKI